MVWDEIARKQAGVVAHSQLIGAGIGVRQIESMLRRGALVRRAQGVYLVRGAPQTYDHSLWVAVLATGGSLGFHTACHEWKMIAEPPAPIIVLVDEPRRIRPPRGVKVRRRSAGFATTSLFGRPVTTRAESVLDHISTLALGPAQTFFDRALQQGWFGPADLERRLSTPRWGNGRLRELAPMLGDGAQANSERILQKLLRAHGIGGWTPNCRVNLNGVTYYIDIAFPEQRLAIEVDGLAFHTGATEFQRDRTRQNNLVSAGWTVLRFTWWDLVNRPEHVIATIVDLLRFGAKSVV